MMHFLALRTPLFLTNVPETLAVAHLIMFLVVVLIVFGFLLTFCLLYQLVAPKLVMFKITHRLRLRLHLHH